jgi:hypothetical protein
MILLLLACVPPKHIGTIDIMDGGLCTVEFGDHFHIYDVSVCNGREEGETIKVK